MMNTLITHFITPVLPEQGYKQLSFLTSNYLDYPDNVFYYGYDGSRKLTDSELSEEMKESKIIRFRKPIRVYKEAYLWIDSEGDIYTSDDVHGVKTIVDCGGWELLLTNGLIQEK